MSRVYVYTYVCLCLIRRFPKNDELCKKWILKCRRRDLLNPKTSFICSVHFRRDDFIRDLKAELLGYTPKIRLLSPVAVPTLHLPIDRASLPMSQSMVDRQNRVAAKLEKQVNYFGYLKIL